MVYYSNVLEVIQTHAADPVVQGHGRRADHVAGESGVSQSRRQRERPGGASHDRGCGTPGTAALRRHYHRGHGWQHGRRAGLGGGGQRVSLHFRATRQNGRRKGASAEGIWGRGGVTPTWIKPCEGAMTEKLFDSDSARHARPLRYAQTVAFDRALDLEMGGQLPSVTVAYETYGQLNAAKDNAVLVCHAISGDSHVAKHDDEDDPGWWDVVVGPGKPIDTSRFFVICPNLLGGCRGTTGPGSLNPATGKPYGADFPIITIGDIVEVQRRLLDHLGIGRLIAVIGGSVGGHQTLTWATRHPDRLRGAVVLASSPRLTSQALAFDVVGRNAIRRDPHYHGGQYYEEKHGPEVGLAIARMIGHITYLSREAMKQKFGDNRLQSREVATEFEKTFSVGSYLGHQGTKFVERFDANSYIALSTAMDLFDLGGTPSELA